jgi:hypothetical protein
MKNRSKLTCWLAIGVALAALVGCTSTVDEVTNTIDCQTVCERYADCFNADYDVDGCIDRCQNSADADAERQRRLRTCDDCIDDRSCTAATFSCADECVGIVP